MWYAADVHGLWVMAFERRAARDAYCAESDEVRPCTYEERRTSKKVYDMRILEFWDGHYELCDRLIERKLLTPYGR